MIVRTDLAHRAQVHRHVRRVGDQVAVGVEQRAGEIEPLLDVDRVRGVGERHAHLLGDRHEQVVEHLEQHRVGAWCRSRARARGASTRSSTRWSRGVSSPRQPGSIDRRRVPLADHRRPGDRVAGTQVVARRRPARRGTRRRCTSRFVFDRRERPARARERGRGVVGGCVAPIASTATASMTSALPGIRKPYCCAVARARSRRRSTPRRRAVGDVRASCRCRRT